MKERGWVGLAAVLGLVAVAAGAFAAHGLEAQGDGRAAAWVEKGSRHQMWHALAMLAYLLHPLTRRMAAAMKEE